jgi:hypothetical protein
MKRSVAKILRNSELNRKLFRKNILVEEHINGSLIFARLWFCYKVT